MPKREKLFLTGTTVERIPTAKLPSKEEVLQRFYHLKNFDNVIDFIKAMR